MARPLNIAGEKYGRLIAVEWTGNACSSGRLWKFKCDCGAEIIASIGQVRSGNTTSCGCFAKEKLRSRNEKMAKHKCTRSPTWNSWSAMRRRCQKQDDKDYHKYGARGIVVCERWQSFENFMADMGERPEGMTIDRVDNNGNYEPENCRWATPLQQSRNSRNSVVIEYQGEKHCVAEWAALVGIEVKTLQYRIRSGWDVEKALSTPSMTNRKRFSI